MMLLLTRDRRRKKGTKGILDSLFDRLGRARRVERRPPLNLLYSLRQLRHRNPLPRIDLEDVHEKLRGVLGEREGGEEGFGISKERAEGFVVEGSFSPSEESNAQIKPLVSEPYRLSKRWKLDERVETTRESHQQHSESPDVVGGGIVGGVGSDFREKSVRT